MAATIRTTGVVQALIVRPLAKPEKKVTHEIVAGADDAAGASPRPKFKKLRFQTIADNLGAWSKEWRGYRSNSSQAGARNPQANHKD
jgi:hypothetical protein